MEYLKEDIKYCKHFVQSHVLMMVSEGLYFHDDSVGNGHIRMLFIDVLTRRFLLRAHTMVTLIN